MVRLHRCDQSRPVLVSSWILSPSMRALHPVAVVLDLVQPLLVRRRLVDDARKLRFDPLRRMSRYSRCGLSFGPQSDGSRINLRTF
jgi:hypothetical protein